MKYINHKLCYYMISLILSNIIWAEYQSCDDEENLRVPGNCYPDITGLSPDDPTYRESIDLESLPKKTIRMNIHTFSNAGTALLSQVQYENLMSQANTNFSSANIQFIGEFLIHENEEIYNCGNLTEEECNSTYCYWFDGENGQFCLPSQSAIANEYAQGEYGSSYTEILNVFVAEFGGSRAGFPWNDLTPFHRSIYLSVEHAADEVTFTHELGHKFGLYHTFYGIGHSSSTVPWACYEDHCFEPTDLPEAGFCYYLDETGCSSEYGCYWDDNFCWHEGDRTGDLISDTRPHPSNRNNCGLYEDIVCSDDNTIEFPNQNSNNNYMSYETCRSKFTIQQIKRMHSWIEYEFEYSSGLFTSMMSFVVGATFKNVLAQDPNYNLGGSLTLYYLDENLDIAINSSNDGIIPITETDVYSVKTDNQVLSDVNDYYHLRWEIPQEYMLKKENFSINDQDGVFAYFENKELIALQSTNNIPIQLHDPWYAYQEADSDHWIQPDEFRPLAEQDDGSGNVQAFLEQNVDFDPALPIYSLKTPKFYTTVDGIYEFIQWSGVQGEVMFDPNGAYTTTALKTDVVFLTPNATVTAEYIPTPINENPYYTAVITEGNTLSIPPGASIDFAPGFTFHVSGELRIDGAELRFENGGSINVIGGLLTINNSNLGAAVDNTWDGINIHDASASSISNTTVSGSVSTGLLIENSSGITLTSLTLQDNKNLLDDPLSSPFEGLSPDEILQFDIETYLNNRVDPDGLGGGLSIVSSQVICDDVRILNNEASVYGGGLYSYYSDVQFNGGLIKDNSMDGMAGGVFSISSDIILSYSLITSNTSLIMGGALMSSFNDNLELKNCTVAGNVSYDGPDILFNDSDSTIIGNSIIFDDSIVLNFDGFNAVTYSDFYNYSGYIPYDESNLFSDPEFIDAANGDFHLRPTSPCINAGDPDSAPDPDGTIADMGAFYYDVIPPVPENLSVSGYFGDHPTITWDAVTVEDFDHYVLRKEYSGPNNYSYTGYVDVYGTSHVDYAFTIQKRGINQAAYSVSSVNWIGHQSDYSASVSVTGDGGGIGRLTEGNPAIPTDYALHPAHPNPFNPVTTIRFDLPEDGPATLTVYDMMGREVTQLANGVMSAGYHSVQWDASNLASGVYMVRLTAGDYTAVQKVSLLK